MRKFLALLLAAVILFSLCSCNSSSDSDKKEKPKSTTENVNSGDILEGAKHIEPGKTEKSKNKFEFTVVGTTFAEDIVPPEASEWYTHYVSADGKIYIDLFIEYYNLSDHQKYADQLVNATMLYGNRYEYNGFPVVELNDRSDFSYPNITTAENGTPLYLHYLFEVPNELYTGKGELSIVFTVEGERYVTVVREGKRGRIAEKDENAVTKKSGEVTVGEIIGIKNKCEFSVLEAELLRDVVPPSAAETYTHYEASEGKLFLDFTVSFKSFDSTSQSADKILSATLNHGEESNIHGISIIEKNGRSDFAYSNISTVMPLSYEYIHYLFEIPAEAAESTTPISVNFDICGNSYTYTVR